MMYPNYLENNYLRNGIILFHSNLFLLADISKSRIKYIKILINSDHLYSKCN